MIERSQCPACDGREFEKVERPATAIPGTGTWYLCKACTLIFQSPIPEDLSKFYETEYRKKNYPSRWDRTVQMVRANRQINFLKMCGAKQIMRALDWGCASGILLEELRLEYDCEIVGVELNPKDQELARRRGATIYPRLEDIPTEVEFDLVVLSHALEHVRDPIAHLSELRRRCIRHAWLILEVPTAISPSAWADFHLLLFEPRSIQIALGRADWRCLAGKISLNETLLWAVAKNDAGVPWAKFEDRQDAELAQYNWPRVETKVNDANSNGPN